MGSAPLALRCARDLCSCLQECTADANRKYASEIVLGTELRRAPRYSYVIFLLSQLHWPVCFLLAKNRNKCGISRHSHGTSATSKMVRAGATRDLTNRPSPCLTAIERNLR
jgi:hypothetical protein